MVLHCVIIYPCKKVKEWIMKFMIMISINTNIFITVFFFEAFIFMVYVLKKYYCLVPVI